MTLSHTTAAALWGLLLLAFGAAAAAIYWPDAPARLHCDRDFWQPDEATLDAWAVKDDANRRAAAAAGEDREALVAAFEAANELAAGRTPVDPSEIRRAQTELEQLATRFAASRGIDAYRGVGVELREELLDAWERGSSKRIGALGGDIVDEARRIGLLDGRARVRRVFLPIFRVAFDQRWLMLIRTSHAVRSLILPAKLDMMERWKVEEHASLEPERRMRLAERISERDADYPSHAVLGCFLANRGQWAGALEAFELERARRPGVDWIEQSVRFLRADAAGEGLDEGR